MSQSKDGSTEEKILKAAEYEFIEKGLSGARMQQIADRAGINKALLHYYYRTKEKLFEVVFRIAFKAFLPRFTRIFEDETSLFEKIQEFTFEYISLISKNPNIPGFVIHELNSNPKRLTEFFVNFKSILAPFRLQIEKEIEAGNIRPIGADQLILNIISLCIFPVIAKPLAMVILYNNEEEEYKKMIEKRKTEVSAFIINSIKLN